MLLPLVVAGDVVGCFGRDMMVTSSESEPAAMLFLFEDYESESTHASEARRTDPQLGSVQRRRDQEVKEDRG